jgi:hypothetical protein
MYYANSSQLPMNDAEYKQVKYLSEYTVHSIDRVVSNVPIPSP